eukprot:scaffold4201_cov119-Isochrysis_galbana.AAC.1
MCTFGNRLPLPAHSDSDALQSATRRLQDPIPCFALAMRSLYSNYGGLHRAVPWATFSVFLSSCAHVLHTPRLNGWTVLCLPSATPPKAPAPASSSSFPTLAPGSPSPLPAPSFRRRLRLPLLDQGARRRLDCRMSLAHLVDGLAGARRSQELHAHPEPVERAESRRHTGVVAGGTGRLKRTDQRLNLGTRGGGDTGGRPGRLPLLQPLSRRAAGPRLALDCATVGSRFRGAITFGRGARSRFGRFGRARFSLGLGLLLP